MLPGGVQAAGDPFGSLPEGFQIGQKRTGILDADEAAEGQRGNDRAAIIADRHGNAGAVHDGFAVVEGVAVALGLPDGLTENRRVGDGVGGEGNHFAGVDDLLHQADGKLGQKNFAAGAGVEGEGRPKWRGIVHQLVGTGLL